MGAGDRSSQVAVSSPVSGKEIPTKPGKLLQKQEAPEPFGSGAKLGGGSSPRSLPVRTHWALSLSRAVCSPTPLFAACEGFSLMAGPSRPLPAGIYRVRPLRPVRPLLASSGHAGRGADTPATCVARVGTVTTGSAPAFGRALAPCYGSDLLTLRLHFALQLGDVVFHAAPRKEVFRALPNPVAPRSIILFARPSHDRRGLFGEVVSPENAASCWSAQ
jgi:hypothetical protein